MSIFSSLPISSSMVASAVSKASPLTRAAGVVSQAQGAINQAKTVVGGAVSSIGGIADLAKAGATFTLPAGASFDGSVPVELGDVIVTGSRAGAPKTDRRVRLKSITGQEEQVYGEDTPSNPMAMLHRTGGMLFPYTPTISFSQDVDYRSSDLTHSNMDILSYNRTPSVTLNIAGKFTAQNQREGQYVVAVLHYLRTVSKMYFGTQDAENGLAGLPPPILILDGYGNHMFNNLRCVVKSHAYTLDESSDYVDVYMNGGATVTRVPAILSLTLTLTVTRSPSAMKDVFSLEKFRNGSLMNNRGGWI